MFLLISIIFVPYVAWSLILFLSGYFFIRFLTQERLIKVSSVQGFYRLLILNSYEKWINSKLTPRLNCCAQKNLSAFPVSSWNLYTSRRLKCVALKFSLQMFHTRTVGSYYKVSFGQPKYILVTKVTSKLFVVVTSIWFDLIGGKQIAGTW